MTALISLVKICEWYKAHELLLLYGKGLCIFVCLLLCLVAGGLLIICFGDCSRLFKARKAIIAAAMANKCKETISQVVDEVGDQT